MKITEILREYDISSYRRGDENDPRSPYYEEPPEDETSTEQVTFPWDVYDADGQNVVATGTVTAEVTGTVDHKGKYQFTGVDLTSFVVNGRTYDRHNAYATFGQDNFNPDLMAEDAQKALQALPPR